jgi:DNA-binding NtrC family response regulator
MRKILIIDDHDDLETALDVIFNSLGHQVTAFDNRTEAVEVSDLADFDLVITDLDNIDHCAALNLTAKRRPSCLQTSIRRPATR